MIGCSLKVAMSRRISGVKDPPAADAPEDIQKYSYRKFRDRFKLLEQIFVNSGELIVS
jgi:hypothetical protein